MALIAMVREGNLTSVFTEGGAPLLEKLFNERKI